MRAKVFEVLDLQRKIQCIKHLRNATGLGLKESKDIVDVLYQGRSSEGIDIHIKDNFTDDDFDAFAEWFDFSEFDTNDSAPKGKLKLFMVIVTDAGRSYMSVVLSTVRERAINEADDAIRQLYNVPLTENRTVTCEEITSFKNGQVLLTSQL